MPTTASNRTVPPKQAALVKAIGKDYALTPAKPSGAYDKLAAQDGRTIVWLIPRASYVRLHFIASVKEAPKALLRDTWEAGGLTQLQATTDNVEQARKLIAWAIEHPPPKAAKKAEPKKAVAPKTRAATKTKTRVTKKRVSFRLPTGDVRTERIPEVEVKAFVKSLKAQGATEVNVS
jgi:hypothetical protein